MTVWWIYLHDESTIPRIVLHTSVWCNFNGRFFLTSISRLFKQIPIAMNNARVWTVSKCILWRQHSKPWPFWKRSFYDAMNNLLRSDATVIRKNKRMFNTKVFILIMMIFFNDETFRLTIMSLFIERSRVCSLNFENIILSDKFRCLCLYR